MSWAGCNKILMYPIDLPGSYAYGSFMLKHASPRSIASAYLCHDHRFIVLFAFRTSDSDGPRYAAARHGFHYGSGCSVLRVLSKIPNIREIQDASFRVTYHVLQGRGGKGEER